MPTQSPEIIYSPSGHLFVGRVIEQEDMRHTLRDMLQPTNPDETLPAIFLLYGDGGIGKTSLSQRFEAIASEEEPFAGAFQILRVDWEEQRRRVPALQVAREQINPDTVLELFYKQAASKWGDTAFAQYQQVKAQLHEVEQEAEKALASTGDGDEMGRTLSRLGTTVLTKVIRTAVPALGDTGEAWVKQGLDLSVEFGAGGVAKIRQAATDKLQRKLKPEQFRLFTSPHEALAQALGRDLAALSNKRQGWLQRAKPLILILDTYEVVDYSDEWVREMVKTAGPHTLWVISGRNNLYKTQRERGIVWQGYAEQFPRRLRRYDVGELATADVQRYFAHAVPDRLLTEGEAQAIGRATRGIPLAIGQAAELWGKGVALANIVGDETQGASHAEIVDRMTERYLLYVADKPEDRLALYALALAEGHVGLLRAMLTPAHGDGAQLEARLAQLARDYAAVHLQERRLHDAATQFVVAYLRDEMRRHSPEVQPLHERAEVYWHTKLDEIQTQYALLEEWWEDEDWQEAVLGLTRAYFWQREDWEWLVPRYVEGLAYGRATRRGLLQVAQAWSQTLSAVGKKRLKALLAIETSFPELEDEAAAIQELERLASKKWLDGDGEAERRAILAWRKGVWLTRQKETQRAVVVLEQAEAGLPAGGSKLVELLGEAMYEVAGKLMLPDGEKFARYSAEAERLLPKVVRWLPEKQGAWYQLGVVFAHAKQYAEAISTFQQAIALDPNEADYHHGFGNVYSGLGRHEEAIVAYQQAITLDPNYALPHNGLGNVYRNLGHHEEAISAYQRAIALDPKNAYFHNGLGNVYSDLGHHEEAISAYQQAIALDPKNAYPHSNLGNVYSGLGRHEEAIVAYQQAITLDPNYALPHNGLGNVYRNLGHHEEAISAYQRAIALDPKNAYFHNGLGNVYSDLGRHEEAISAYQQAIALDPKLAYPHNGLGNVYCDLGRHEEAIAAYQQAITLDPNYAYPHHGLGNVYSDLGRYEEAITAYGKSIELQPRATPYKGLGDVYRNLGRYEEAISAYQQAIVLEPQDGAWHGTLAGLYRQMGQEAEYQKHIEIARGLIAKENEYDRACLEAIVGNHEEALTLLAQTLAKGQSNRLWAQQDPDFASLRHAPRFQALVHGSS